MKSAIMSFPCIICFSTSLSISFQHIPVSIEVDEDKLIVSDGGVNGGGVEVDSARLREGERNREEEERQHSPRLPIHGNL